MVSVSNLPIRVPSLIIITLYHKWRRSAIYDPLVFLDYFLGFLVGLLFERLDKPPIK